MKENIIEFFTALSVGLALSLFCNMLPIIILIMLHFEDKKNK